MCWRGEGVAGERSVRGGAFPRITSQQFALGAAQLAPIKKNGQRSSSAPAKFLPLLHALDGGFAGLVYWLKRADCKQSPSGSRKNGYGKLDDDLYIGAMVGKLVVVVVN